MLQLYCMLKIAVTKNLVCVKKFDWSEIYDDIREKKNSGPNQSCVCVCVS